MHGPARCHACGPICVVHACVAHVSVHVELLWRHAVHTVGSFAPMRHIDSHGMQLYCSCGKCELHYIIKLPIKHIHQPLCVCLICQAIDIARNDALRGIDKVHATNHLSQEAKDQLIQTINARDLKLAFNRVTGVAVHR